MTDAEIHAWIGLAALVDDVGARRLAALLDAAGSPERAWAADRALLARAGCMERTAERFAAVRASVDPTALTRACARAGIAVIPRGDSQYPPFLAAIPDPPIALFVRGDADLLCTRALAVIGTRTATPYGNAACAMLVEPLARSGLTITSGLAYGIDGVAHDACLRAGGRTVAVLGTGSDPASISPSAHRGLADRIVASGGCVVSEYVPGTDGRPMHFPARNRIVAGTTVGTLVVEAPKDSGALITAQFALDFGREVFAVPGPITSAMSAGANALLRNGATPVTAAADIMDALHLDELLPPSCRTLPSYDGVAGRIVSALGTVPVHVDALRATVGAPAPEVIAALTTLELDGSVRDIGGGRYIRMP